jgi:hypothetical protein
MTVHRSTSVAASASVVHRSSPRTDGPARLMPVAFATGALVASMLSASLAHAAPADRQLFTWSGRVDREVYITMRGRDVRTSGADAGLPNRARVNDPLPRGRGDVLVRLIDGRGDVQVIEQPSARNGYATTIRIRDPRGGADSYRVAAYWQGDERFDDRRDDRNGRDDDRRGRNDCGPNNNGRGGGWGRGGRQDDCDYRPGGGNGNGNRDRDDRGGRDDRNDRNGRNDRDGTSGALRWSGRVDDVVEIRINGRRVDAITRSGRRVENVNSNVRGGALPSRDVTVSLDRHSGRGNVQVVQQPSSWNNYTAVIRIHDPQGGASFYDFSAFWN